MGSGATRSLLRTLDVELACVIIFGPVYWYLASAEARRRAADPARARSAVRKWTGFTILLVTSLIMLITLTFLLAAFLRGDADLGFWLKALTVVALDGAILMLYRLQLAGPGAEDA